VLRAFLLFESMAVVVSMVVAQMTVAVGMRLLVWRLGLGLLACMIRVWTQTEGLIQVAGTLSFRG